MWKGWVVALFLPFVSSQVPRDDKGCPEGWIEHKNACYKFVSSPNLNETLAKDYCTVS